MTSTIAKLAPLVLAFAVNGVWAHGDVKCTTRPKSEWKPHTELHEKLTKEGWVVRRMEATASCYEVYAKDPDGKRIEAFFDPVTFARVEEK
ncbi:PepSY domain-containing protein [Massilia sp. P8910]|uniref:PepSY domain-containing protein n=1 Tax=Massilia antarctica TaxID=2765360 RepID=A0AA49AA28_9BURK|nr:PepSY domain-containing protein [Massilia antarctica]MCE3602663.1 PepSY domain-containing protein [Massilia antarctica]QPI52039.1 PepSY domain-containing protein [Massilia antarctica]